MASAFPDRQRASHYELDYLITPELGGAPDPRNLWPQRYASRAWNALVKDQLERLLPRLVCAHQLDLRTAQREIASDWVAAYKKYFKTPSAAPGREPNGRGRGPHLPRLANGQRCAAARDRVPSRRRTLT